MLYDLIRIAAQEIRIVDELFDFHTNYGTNLIRIVYTNCLYDFDTNCVNKLLIRICYELHTNHIRIVYELIRTLKGDDMN